MRRVFAFDFDGTLTTTDTLIAVIRYARGTAALAVGLLLYSPMLVLMKMGLYPNWKAKQRLFAHFFGGWSLARFDSCCQQFAATHSHLLRPEGIRLMRQVLAEGAQVAIDTVDDVEYQSLCPQCWYREYRAFLKRHPKA